MTEANRHFPTVIIDVRTLSPEGYCYRVDALKSIRNEGVKRWRMNVQVYQNSKLRTLIESKSKHSDLQLQPSKQSSGDSAQVFDINTNIEQLSDYAVPFIHQQFQRQTKYCAWLTTSGLN